MSEPTDDFEYERRFFCRELPAEYDDGDAPTLIIKSYYVHADNYALRVRLVYSKEVARVCSSVDRASVSGTEGRGFDPHQAHHKDK